MAAPLEDSVGFFIEQVFANETLLRSERKTLIRSAVLSLGGNELFVENLFADETLDESELKTTLRSEMLSLAAGIERGVDRWGKSMQIGKMCQEAMRPRKKNRIEG